MKIIFVGKTKWVIFALLIAITANVLAVNEFALPNNYNEDEYRIFKLVNTERHKRRLNDLVWDDNLARMARDYSKKMAREIFFDHADFDGKTVVDRAEDSRIKNWSKIGENLFYYEANYDFDNLAVRGWMRSPTHRENILDETWTATGIGIAESRDGRIYITQVFLEN